MQIADMQSPVHMRNRRELMLSIGRFSRLWGPKRDMDCKGCVDDLLIVDTVKSMLTEYLFPLKATKGTRNQGSCGLTRFKATTVSGLKQPLLQGICSYQITDAYFSPIISSSVIIQEKQIKLPGKFADTAG